MRHKAEKTERANSLREQVPETPWLEFLDESFASGQLKTSGTSVDEIMPPMSRFDGSRAEKKQRIIEKLNGFFNKYFGLGKD